MLRSAILIPALLVMIASRTGIAQNSFTISEIRFEGLERVSPEAVAHDLPLSVGETAESSKVQDLIRKLYGMSLFDDIEARRDGDALIVAVRERPVVSRLTITGAESLNMLHLMQSLSAQGIGYGQHLDRAAFASIVRQIVESFFERGQFRASVDSDLQNGPNDSIEVHIAIREGKPSTLRRVSFVGNRRFDDETLAAAAKVPIIWASWNVSSSGRSAAASETRGALRTHYLNQGYIDFQVESVDLSIAQNLTDLYLRIVVTEGQQYTVSGVTFSGDYDASDQELEKHLSLRPGEVFDMSRVVSSQQDLTEFLVENGFRYADVSAVPEVDKRSAAVSVRFVIDAGPGK